jgi:hypothetical protein
MIKKISTRNDFLPNIAFSNEATFHLLQSATSLLFLEDNLVSVDIIYNHPAFLEEEEEEEKEKKKEIRRKKVSSASKISHKNVSFFVFKKIHHKKLQ